MNIFFLQISDLWGKKQNAGFSREKQEMGKLRLLITWVLWDGFQFWKQFWNQCIMLINLSPNKIYQAWKIIFFNIYPPRSPLGAFFGVEAPLKIILKIWKK